MGGGGWRQVWAFSHGLLDSVCSQNCPEVRYGSVLGSHSGIFTWWPRREPGLGHASIYLRSCASSHLSLLCSLGQGFYIQDFQSVAKNIMTELSFFCMHSQLSFLFQSLSTNITFPWLPWASFEATRAVAFSHGGQEGGHGS